MMQDVQMKLNLGIVMKYTVFNTKKSFLHQPIGVKHEEGTRSLLRFKA
jgi:hypothetical protein